MAFQTTVEYGLCSMLTVTLLSTLLSTATAAQTDVCQKAYLSLRSGCLKTLDSPAIGCCALLSAFNVRGCLTHDANLQTVRLRAERMLQPLQSACQQAGGNEIQNILPAAHSTSVKVELHDDTGIEEVVSVKTAMALADGALSTMEEEELDRLVSGGADLSLPSDPITVSEIISLRYDSGNTQVLCSCVGKMLPPPGENAGWKTRLSFKYMEARLWLCQFACRFRCLITMILMLQVAVLGAWMVVLFKTRPSTSARSDRRNQQFIVYNAADPEWTEPLLDPEENA